MNDENKFIVTPDGLLEVKSELEKLYKERRVITDQIKEAKSYGDLSENSEYAEVKERQVILESRIAELENIIRNAVVESRSCSLDDICVGSVVQLQVKDKERQYTLVGSTQGDPVEGKISVDSPVGRSLLGRKKGDEVEVMTPGGKMRMKVLAIK